MSKILFLHGLDSCKKSSKFHAINTTQKYCIDVDYRNLSYSSVADFYHDTIKMIKPDILVGHSLGGYWALKMSQAHQLPCIVANPSLQPNFRDDYPIISDQDLQHDIPQFAYLELGDEILDMHAVQICLEDYMQIQAIEGGHHRLAHPEQLNQLIQEIEKHFIRQ
ncbi:esterase [Acinetobacter bohemicus]|uniref:Esterase n=1 Tax=Acinetobacter lwoffii TaxID=28090 RepID=A0A9D2UTK8_ACILW|nr:MULTISPECIES: YqiA/YcfP family alpha/beta fold hydrolase [Acinetobacter]MCO8041564.1 esterase [Acinetobacter sp. S4400-12]MCU7223588.1 esterase [Acinetobacter bohemicus]HJF28420.1 esterase [Acinetobacter lwoffii]